MTRATKEKEGDSKTHPKLLTFVYDQTDQTEMKGKHKSNWHDAKQTEQSGMYTSNSHETDHNAQQTQIQGVSWFVTVTVYYNLVLNKKTQRQNNKEKNKMVKQTAHGLSRFLTACNGVIMVLSRFDHSHMCTSNKNEVSR